MPRVNSCGMKRVQKSVQAVTVSKTKTTAVKVVVKQDAVSHPTYLEMAKAAISDLQERTGSSKQAILKYITGTYGITEDKKVSAHLRKALVNGVASGDLNQPSGSGANGSFKLNKDKNGATKKKTVAAPKKAVEASKKKTDPVAAAPKKTVTAPKKSIAAPMKAVAAPKKKSEPVAAAPKKTVAAPKKSIAAPMKAVEASKKKSEPGTIKKKTTSDDAKPAPVKRTASTRSRAAK